MTEFEDERDARIGEFLEDALSELRTRGRIDVPSWQTRFPELAADVDALFETLKDLDAAAETWKVFPEQLETQAPETGPSVEPAEALAGHVSRYRILERVGGGGMGTVYKAYDPQLERTVALKVPHLQSSRQDGAVAAQRFLREARAAAQVRHAHICPIYDVGEQNGLPFVVMAYVAGQSLADRLHQQGAVTDPRQGVEWARQVAEALEAVHRHGIVHRDLKPGNILLDEAGQALLTDFGLARPDGDLEHLTSEGVLVGTIPYMAPEQAAGQAERIGPGTDLYSLGVVLFELLTGQRPFEGSAVTVLQRIALEVPPPPSRFRTDLDPALERIVTRAMARQPEDRFPSAGALAEALAQWLAGVPAVVAPAQHAPETGVVSGQSRTTLVEVHLPDGSPVRIKVDHPAAAPGTLSVKVTEQRLGQSKRKRPRRLTIAITLALASVLAVLSVPLWQMFDSSIEVDSKRHGSLVAFWNAEKEKAEREIALREKVRKMEWEKELKEKELKAQMAWLEKAERDRLEKARKEAEMRDRSPLTLQAFQQPTQQGFVQPAAQTQLALVQPQQPGFTAPPPAYLQASPYSGAYYPTGSTMKGSANVQVATGQYYQAVQQARILTEQVQLAQIDMRRKLLEELRYEKPLNPNPVEVRLQELARELRRSRKDPSATEISSGKAMNDLLDAIKRSQLAGLRGPTILLDEDQVKQLNLSTGTTVANVGLLKDGGNMQWPPMLRDRLFDNDRKKISELAQRISSEVKSGQISNETQVAFRDAVNLLGDRVGENIQEVPPTQFIEASRYVNVLKATSKALLQDPNVANQFNGKYQARGKTVSELVDMMIQNGLKFDAASPGGEKAYTAIYHGLLSYDQGLSQYQDR
jgi:hypothetical protein